MTAIANLRRRVAAVVFAQAARVIEQAARQAAGRAAGRAAERGSGGSEVGGDIPPQEEALHFAASDRMSLTANDIADISDDPQVRVTANVLGLAGATPALPPYYSELQLQRRRLRDRSFASFLNLFDHRALSFFYRVFRKYNWTVAFEREAVAGNDPASRAILALAGFATPGSRLRLGLDDAVLIPLAGHLGDSRRSAASVETVLRQVTGLSLRVVEAEPMWLALPAAEQTRLGGPALGHFTRLGGVDPLTGLGSADAALVGATVLDIQHHYAVEIGPLSHRGLLDFCREGGMRRAVGEACLLAAGIEHQPVIRLSIAAGDVPPLRLGVEAVPALLGWTAWLGAPDPDAGILSDCVIPVDRAAIGAGF